MGMVEVKTAELAGPALDWAVAQCEGVETCWLYGRGLARIHDFHGNRLIEELRPIYSPSTLWSQGGPLIEKCGIGVARFFEPIDGPVMEGMEWAAIWIDDSVRMDGPTALIAACRAIVAAKLGDTVRVPAALVGGGA